MIITSNNNIPEWLNSIVKEEESASSKSSSINITKASEVKEEVIDKERNRIDVFASTGEKYIINSEWKQEHKSHLKEYAQVMGVMTEEKKPKDIIASSKKMTKTSQTKELEFDVPKSKIHSEEHMSFVSELRNHFDPFGINEEMNKEEPQPDEWEKVTAAQKLNYKPLMDSKIVPIRGGEKTNIESKLSLAENQNSIDNPNQIKELISSKSLDGGERIKKSLAEKEEQKKTNHKEWEQNILDSMPDRKLMPNKNVFMTEALNAQEGLNNNMTTFEGMSEEELPELTAGEQIKTQNEQKLAQIQRPKEKDDWETMSKEATYSYDDMFLNSLEQKLKGKK